MNQWLRNLKSGFTLVELLVVIVFLFLIAGLLPFGGSRVHEKARRVNCLSNQNGIWKSVAAQNLDPDTAFVTNFPSSNLTGPHGIFTPIGGITPEMFICPTAAGDYGTRPANTLSEMTASNSSYCYFGGRIAKDGDRVLLCDQDGSMTVATANHWGRNHRGKRGLAQGGNIIKVSGAGMWIDTTNVLGTTVCITNAVISSTFQTDSNTVVFLY